MPQLGFQNQFAPLVESGEKRQTIRAYRKDGRDPKVGDRLYLYTGMRTKQCRKLGEAVVTQTLAIELYGIPSPWSYRAPRMKLTDTVSGQTHIVGTMEAEAQAKLDGFSSFDRMHEWFKGTHGLPFEGLLIRWGDIELSPNPAEGGGKGTNNERNQK